MSQSPIYLPIPLACARWGASRTGLYRLAGEGHIIFVKLGRRTLADVASGDKYFTSLPVAKIKASAPRGADQVEGAPK